MVTLLSDSGTGQVDVDAVGARGPLRFGTGILGEELVDGDVVVLGEALQARDRDGPLAAFVGAEDGRLEFLAGGRLHRLEREALLAAHVAQSLADASGVGCRHLIGHR
jgi:hypothetical protein